MKQRISNEEQIEQALKDWEAVKVFKNGRTYELTVKPIEDEIEKLGRSYEAKTLLEMATIKGEYKGLKRILDIIDGYERSGRSALEAKQMLEQKRLKEQREFDSRDL